MNVQTATIPSIQIVDTAPRTSARPARPKHQHSTATQVLHWASALALLVAALTIVTREFVEHPLVRTWLLEAHRQAGLFVMLACVARLVVRVRVGLADTMGSLPLVLRAAAHAAHVAIYGALLALPVLGWAATNAHGLPLRVLGLLRLPMLTGEDADLADRLGDFHAWAAWALLALVLAHVAAALWHHWVRRDGVLHAMLPLVQRRRAARAR